MIIDLTHTFTDAMPTYPSDPMATLRQSATLTKDGYVDHLLSTGLHVGTHIDAPAHMIEGGKKIHELSIELFSGKGVVVDARGKRALDVDLISGRSDLPFGKAGPVSGGVILFCTGFYKKIREPEYFTDFPMMTEALAKELVKRKVTMVGLDTPSPDRSPFAVHKILLGAGILIIENLTNLEALLPHKQFQILAFPIKLAADAAPARVVAMIR